MSYKECCTKTRSRHTYTCTLYQGMLQRTSSVKEEETRGLRNELQRTIYAMKLQNVFL